MSVIRWTETFLRHPQRVIENNFLFTDYIMPLCLNQAQLRGLDNYPLKLFLSGISGGATTCAVIDMLYQCVRTKNRILYLGKPAHILEVFRRMWPFINPCPYKEIMSDCLFKTMGFLEIGTGLYRFVETRKARYDYSMILFTNGSEFIIMPGLDKFEIIDKWGGTLGGMVIDGLTDWVPSVQAAMLKFMRDYKPEKIIVIGRLLSEEYDKGRVGGRGGVHPGNQQLRYLYADDVWKKYYFATPAVMRDLYLQMLSRSGFRTQCLGEIEDAGQPQTDV